MNLLFRIVYAAHANGTHHKLALDALRHLTGDQAEKWQRLFLQHAELYLNGSKAPDNEFKDFKNHVLHVRDGYWGGAADKAQAWYEKLIKALKEESWPEAVYCAGVLSHYYTDPIHPFHTAQSEAENNIHRAVEWSISKSYDEIRRLGDVYLTEIKIEPNDGPGWLRDLVCQGAERSNGYYEKLIAHYDFHRGVVDPPAGLDALSRELLAELVTFAVLGFARVLDRAFEEAQVQPPSVNLTAETVVATLKVPLKWVTKKLANAEDRRTVEAMYDELMATGRVEESLPEDDRIVRELHAKEVVAPRTVQQAEQRTAALAKASQIPSPLIHARKADEAESGPPVVEAQSEPPTPAVPIVPANALTDTRPKVESAVPHIPKAETGKRLFLVVSDDVERAPSIGPKMAERLAAIGIKSVSDLLTAAPADAAKDLGASGVSARTVEDWQDQSRLVASVPELRGTHAQLLVGAGYRSAEALARADGPALLAAILRFAGTSEGQRTLRDGHPPDLEKVLAWIGNAAAVKAA